MEKDHLEIILEDIQSKFEPPVLEGHGALHQEIKEMRQDMNERFELVDFKIDTLNKKIDNVDVKLTKKIDDVEGSLRNEINRVEQKVDNVAADLSAHRTDTESHGKGYKVSES